MVTIVLHRGTEKIFMKFKGHTLIAFLRQSHSLLLLHPSWTLGWSNKSECEFSGKIWNARPLTRNNDSFNTWKIVKNRTIKKNSLRDQLFAFLTCQRPYHVEHTSSRPITEVKQHWARIVLGWETAWEHRVLLAFYILSQILKRKWQEVQGT